MNQKKGKRKKPNFIVLIFIMYVGYVLSPIGWNTIYHSLSTIINAYQSSSWEKTTGIIAKSDVRQFKSRSLRHVRQTIYAPDIEYTYTVEGLDHNNSILRHQERSSRRKSDIIEIVNQYPKGKKVNVYYDRNDSGRACLEPGLIMFSFVFLELPFGLIIFAFSVFLIGAPIIDLLKRMKK